MENDTSRDLLKWARELADTAYHLALHTSQHGIKLARSKIFFIVFARLRQDLKLFKKCLNRKWHISKELSKYQLNLDQSTLEPIHTTYSHLLKSHFIIVKATFQAFAQPIQEILQNTKITKKLKCSKTLNSYDDSWIGELPQYDWKMLSQHLQELENIEWKLLLLAPSEIETLKNAHQTLQNQYRALSLVALYPDLKDLKAKICQLRYDSINYNTTIQNEATLQNLRSFWNLLSKQFKTFSNEWDSITSPLREVPLHIIGKTLIEEYNSLAFQYYSLLEHHLSILKAFQGWHTAPTKSSIQRLTHKKSHYNLRAEGQTYDRERLDFELSKILTTSTHPTQESNQEEYPDTSSSSCVTPIMVN